MSTYDSYEPRSNFGLYVGGAFFVAALVAGGVYYWKADGGDDGPEEKVMPVVEKKKDPTVMPPGPADPFNIKPEDPVAEADTVMPEPAEQTLVDLGMGVKELDPQALLKKIGESLEQGQFEQAAALIGKDALDESHLEGLKELSSSGEFRLHALNPVTEIGELEANRRARWALNMDSDLGERIYFDLLRNKVGKWGVEKINIPPKGAPGGQSSKAVLVDSLGITHAFLEAALAQNFDDAKSFVDTSLVSDAKIAGLCIIFEEAKYQLRRQKPLQAMFNRELTAGFIARVQDDTGEKAADFGVSVKRSAPDQPWRVTEVNLDSLLADYANRVAGGDVYYTPLVKNPEGGDTLILYFGFDEDGLTPRTRNQLDIVAGLLKLDAGKKLTLSGHTDSLGTDDYNANLSAKRARAVETYLLANGVPKSQIVALAEGESKPRLPNQTETGEDNPTGRRANRRTEIYLDF